MAKTNNGTAAITALCELFPSCFVLLEARRRPLKVGIARDLIERGVPHKQVRRALGFYVHNISYQRALAAGAARIDLTGAEAGHVTEDEAAHAAEQVKELRRQRQQRRRAKQSKPAPAGRRGPTRVWPT